MTEPGRPSSSPTGWSTEPSPPAEEPAAASPGPSYAEEATRQLRRARKLLTANDFEESPEATFLLESAKVLGVLSLAEAVRDLKG